MFVWKIFISEPEVDNDRPLLSYFFPILAVRDEYTHSHGLRV